MFPWRSEYGKVGLAQDALYLIRPDTYVALAIAPGCSGANIMKRLAVPLRWASSMVQGGGRRRGVTCLRSPNRLDQAASLSPTSCTNVRTLESTHCFS